MILPPSPPRWSRLWHRLVLCKLRRHTWWMSDGGADYCPFCGVRHPETIARDTDMARFHAEWAREATIRQITADILRQREVGQNRARIFGGRP